MKLYDYWRSSAAYRVRIVLNLKELSYEHISINLAEGEQRSDEHLARNPLGLVPALELDDGTLLTQSFAICEYLEEVHGGASIWPSDPIAKAQARAFCFDIAGEMHPLYNLRVRNYLSEDMKQPEEVVDQWYAYWSSRGLDALEETAKRLPNRGKYLFGDQPSLAEVFLVPQYYNAKRFDIDTSSYGHLNQAFDAVKDLPAFAAALPEAQPDAS